jgi:hypothetical protein
MALKIATVFEELAPIRRNPRFFPYRVGRYINSKSRGRLDNLLRHRPLQQLFGAVSRQSQQQSSLHRELALSGIVVAPITESEARELFLGFYGVAPRYTRTGEWTNTGLDPPANFWHRDNESPMSMKLFTYLNHVGPNNGPHQYGIGSHLDRLKRYEGEQPKGRVLTVTGEAGTTFLEVPHGLHRSTAVREGKRAVRAVHLSYHWKPDMERL